MGLARARLHTFCPVRVTIPGKNCRERILTHDSGVRLPHDQTQRLMRWGGAIVGFRSETSQRSGIPSCLVDSRHQARRLLRVSVILTTEECAQVHLFEPNLPEK